MRTTICPAPLHFRQLTRHFLALTASDRFLRFGRVIGDADIISYVEALFVRAATVFVVVEPARAIAGAAHLEFTEDGAFLGLSVSAEARGKGIGTLLLERAALLANARGISALSVRNLGLNAPLRRMARRMGMKIACAPDVCPAQVDPAAAREGPVPARPFAGITLADEGLSPRPNTEPDFASRSVDCSTPISSRGANHVDYSSMRQ